MFVPPISPVSGTGYVAPTARPDFPRPESPATGGVSFGSALAQQIDGVQAMQANTERLAVRAVTGDLADVHQYTVAATQSSVALELTATVRNRAVEAFNEIMRMQA